MMRNNFAKLLVFLEACLKGFILITQIMPSQRIASFLPSATEILYLLGVGDRIACVTHECDYPIEAKSKPRVIKPPFDHTLMSSNEIDSQITKMMQSDGEIYILDEQVLKKSNPDLVVAQGLCDVCSPATKEVSKAVSLLDVKPEVVILDPHNLDDILNDILKVAKYVNKTEQAQNLISSLQKRLEFVREKSVASRPKVLCIEWLDPLFTAGHWVPQMVEIVGGINGISLTGERSRKMK